MAFKFKRTIPAQQVSVSLSAREWEVVRKFVYAGYETPLHDIYGELVEASSAAPWFSNSEDIQEYLGTSPTEDVEVKVGDWLRHSGEWLPVVALSRNGEEAVVDGGEGGVYVLTQEEVEDHRPAQEAPAETYTPKVGDRVRATSTRNHVTEEVVGKVGVVSELSSCGRIKVKYEKRVGGHYVWWLQDFEPAQIVGKEYIHETHGRCTLTRSDGDRSPIMTLHRTGQSCAVYDNDLTPA